MKAKCVGCLDNQTHCEKCEGTGFMSIGIAKGQFYTLACLNLECGFENGGRVVNERYPLPNYCDRKCVACGSNAYWKHIGVIE